MLFGATVLAAATSLPELSTGLTSVRNGDYQLAISDIFGGNAFLPVLFLLATLLSGKAVLPQAHDTDIYLTAVAIVLTLVYMAGLLFRPGRRIARMGVDSLAVLVLYLVASPAWWSSPRGDGGAARSAECTSARSRSRARGLLGARAPGASAPGELAQSPACTVRCPLLVMTATGTVFPTSRPARTVASCWGWRPACRRPR